MILGVSGVLGGVAGAQFALLLDGVTLQRLFAGFLVVMALRTLRKGKRRDPEPPEDAADPSDPAA